MADENKIFYASESEILNKWNEIFVQVIRLREELLIDRNFESKARRLFRYPLSQGYARLLNDGEI